MEKCDKGHEGYCCCNCANQIKIHRHCTFDKTKKDKGCICDQPFIYKGKEAYLCAVGDEETGIVHGSIMSKHGMCEMWYSKESKVKNSVDI